MLSEEGATEVWLSLLLTSLSLPLAIKNLKRGKTSSYERHPQYLRMVGFQEKNLFKLSLFLEFFSKRRKCLPEVEFFPWVFGLSFVLEFQFFRRPVWKKRACDTTRFYVFTYLLHRRNRFLGFITELEHQTPPALLMRAERVAWTHYEICDQEEVWNNYRPIYLYVLRGTWIHDLVQHIMAKWVPLYILKLLGNRQFSSKKHWNQQKVSSFIYSETFSWHIQFSSKKHWNQQNDFFDPCWMFKCKQKNQKTWKTATQDGNTWFAKWDALCPVSSHYIILPKVQIFKKQ